MARQTPVWCAACAETEDENARAVIGAMADVAPKWASFVREVARGDLSQKPI